MQITSTELTALKAALTADHHSRSAYVGRIAQTENVVIIGEDGTPFETAVTFTISWDSIQKMLGLINRRAGQVSIPRE